MKALATNVVTRAWLLLACLCLLGCGKEGPKKKSGPKKSGGDNPALRVPLKPPGPPAAQVADRPHRPKLDLTIAPTGSVGRSIKDYPLKYRKAMALIDTYEGNANLLLEARKLALSLLVESKTNRSKRALAEVVLGRVSYKAGFRKTSARRPANLAQAAHHFAEALRLSPGLFEALLLRGHSHLFAGDLKKARADLARATRRRKKSVDLYTLRTAIAAREKKHDEVIRLETELLGKTTHKWLRRGAYTQLATLHERRKEVKKAEAAYRALLKLVPDSVWAHLSYAGFSINRGRYDTAVKHARKGLTLMDFPPAHHIYGQALFAKGRDLLWGKKHAWDAWGYFLRAIKHVPRDADIHYALGKALQLVARLKRSLWALDRAGAAFRKALEIAPKHTLAAAAAAEHKAGYAKAKRWIESSPK